MWNCTRIMFPGANASEKETDPEARNRCEVAERDNTTFFSPFRSPDTAKFSTPPVSASVDCQHWVKKRSLMLVAAGQTSSQQPSWKMIHVYCCLFNCYNYFFIIGKRRSGQELYSVKQINSGINQINGRRTMSRDVYSKINCRKKIHKKEDFIT